MTIKIASQRLCVLAGKTSSHIVSNCLLVIPTFVNLKNKTIEIWNLKE